MGAATWPGAGPLSIGAGPEPGRPAWGYSAEVSALAAIAAWTLLAAPARAWDFAPLDPVALDAAPTLLAPIPLGPKLGIVLSDGAAVWLLNPTTGDVLDRVLVGSLEDGGLGRVLALDTTTPSGASAASVLLCGPGGLWSTGPTASGLLDPSPIDAEPCAAVLADGDTLAAAQATLTLYPWDGEAWGAPVASALPVPAEPLLALAWPSLGLGGRGSDTLALLDLDTAAESTRLLPGGPGGLAALEDGIAVSLPETDEVLVPDGTRWPVLPLPGPMQAGDFDGDGALELLLHRPATGALSVLDPRTGAEQALELGEVGLIAVGDPNGDGCTDLLFTDSAGLTLTLALGCFTLQTLDQDGDGQTPADGDCDDADDSVYAGAEELCDGLDNSCEGQVDEVPDAVALAFVGDPARATEGDLVSFTATPTTCDTAAMVSWTWEGPAECEATRSGLDCLLLDDGPLGVAATLGGSAGELATSRLTVEVANFAPLWLDWPPDGLRLDAGEELARALEVLDVDADTVSVTLVSGPEGMVLTDGVLSFWSLRPGEYGYTLRATDEDGGVSDLDLGVVVERSSGGGMSCLGLGALLFGGLAGWLVARGAGLLRM